MTVEVDSIRIDFCFFNLFLVIDCDTVCIYFVLVAQEQGNLGLQGQIVASQNGLYSHCHCLIDFSLDA